MQAIQFEFILRHTRIRLVNYNRVSVQNIWSINRFRACNEQFVYKIYSVMLKFKIFRQSSSENAYLKWCPKDQEQLKGHTSIYNLQTFCIHFYFPLMQCFCEIRSNSQNVLARQLLQVMSKPHFQVSLVSRLASCSLTPLFG